MGEMIIQLRVMPNSPEIDMEELSSKVKEKIAEIVSSKTEDMKTSLQDIAFGLKALNVYFVVDESIASLDEVLIIAETRPKTGNDVVLRAIEKLGILQSVKVGRDIYFINTELFNLLQKR